LSAHAYVYFVYGMHHCLNVVTGREGYPAAILIRRLEPLEGIEVMRARRGGRPDAQLTSGPARLCQALNIGRRFDGADLFAPDTLLFLEQDAPIPDDGVATGPRIGVRGDEVAVTIPWRFYIRDNRYVSR
jgi:DNA-3-methyladenine glycosylase